MDPSNFSFPYFFGDVNIDDVSYVWYRRNSLFPVETETRSLLVV